MFYKYGTERNSEDVDSLYQEILYNLVNVHNNNFKEKISSEKGELDLLKFCYTEDLESQSEWNSFVNIAVEFEGIKEECDEKEESYKMKALMEIRGRLIKLMEKV